MNNTNEKIEIDTIINDIKAKNNTIEKLLTKIRLICCDINMKLPSTHQVGLVLHKNQSSSPCNYIDRKITYKSDIVITGKDKIEKNRYGPSGIITRKYDEFKSLSYTIKDQFTDYKCTDKNCGTSEPWIQKMKDQLAAYEAKYGKLKETIDILDDSLTFKK